MTDMAGVCDAVPARNAFQDLFAQNVEYVTAICRQRLRSAADVDDAVQETFTRALANLDSLRDGASFGPWVRSIAVRVCVDHHRAAARTFATPVDELDLTDAAPGPDEMLVAAEHSAGVRRTLQELGERDARALWLRHVTDAPVASVASELGLTEGSTRVLLTRARHRLRAATASLPALLPLSWRQWLRDHLPAAGPAADALVAVVAVGIVATVIGIAGPPGPDSAEADTGSARTVVEESRRERAKDDQRAQSQTQSRSQRRGEDRTSATTRRDRTTAAPAATPRNDLLAPVDSRVKVRNEYPKSDEAEPLADVEIFSEEEESDTHLYGSVPKPVKDAREAAPSVPDDGIEAGGVHIGKKRDDRP